MSYVGATNVGIWHITTLLALLLVGPMAEAQERMVIDGDTLIFDTGMMWTVLDEPTEIVHEDATLFAELVMDYPNVKNVVVSGVGGDIFAAYEMASKVADFDLNVVARGDCNSACVVIFLGGNSRTLEHGARLGFHRGTTDAINHQDFYEAQKEEMGWADEFSYASWVYEEAQVDARNFVEYLFQRGVEPEFALKVLTYSSDDMWYPGEDEMRAAGVIRE
jgi:hypothetical protein